MRWAGHVARYGEQKCKEGFDVKIWRKVTSMIMRRWEDNIKTGLNEKGCEGLEWMNLAHHRDNWRAVVSTVMNLRASQNTGNFLKRCGTSSF